MATETSTDRVKAIITLAEHPNTEETLRTVAVNRLASLAKGSDPAEGLESLIDTHTGVALDITGEWEDRLRSIRELGGQVRLALTLGKRNPDTRYRLPEVWYGAKYNRSLNLVQIAALLRAEIKVSRFLGALPPDGTLAVPDPVADAPAGIKVSVTSSYKGRGSIRITVKNVPKDWGWCRGVDYRDPWETERWLPTQALQNLLDALESLRQAYNYDGSDAMVDHFDTNYYGGTDVDWRERPRD